MDFIPMPLVSVIIPTHNRIQSVSDAIESVLDQSFQNFELIVVDDGSTDGTAKQLTANFQSKLTLLSVQNSGVSSARNIGAGKSQGEFLSFLDSDDIWHRDKLKTQVDFHQENPQFQISQTEEHWIRKGKRVNPMNKHKKPAGYIFPQSLHLCTVSPSSVMIKKSLFDQTGGFDEQLMACEDYDFWLRITSGHQVALIEQKLLTKYGGHVDQLSQRYPAMDRFRLYSLCKVLLSATLNNIQQSQVREVIVEKLKVLTLGAEKRGRETLPLEKLIRGVIEHRISQQQFLNEGKVLLLDDARYRS